MTEQEFITEWCSKIGGSRAVFDSGERVAVRCYFGGNACHGWRALLNDLDRLEEHAMSDGDPGNAGGKPNE